MTVGDGHSGIGRTSHSWDPDVHNVVQALFSRFSSVSANTYTCHPFCGWERRSVDVWGELGRGHALDRHFSQLILDFLFTLPGEPMIRHYILDHVLWTSFGGYGVWPADDHTGRLRHVHVTYWPVPPIR
jgi:hypothetical protein